MSKRKPTPAQLRVERQHLLMSHANNIRELYPTVISISVSYTTSLAGAGGWQNKQHGPYKYCSDTKTIFEYNCPHDDCAGSLQLGTKINDLILSHTMSYSGQIICQNKVRGHQCWVRFDYIIDVDYAK